MKLGSAYVAITTDLKPLNRGLKTGYSSVSSTVSKMSKSFVNFGKSLFSLKTIAIAAFAGWGIKKIIDDFVGLANTQEAVEHRLGAVLKATKGAAGFTLSELKKLASGLQSVTTYGDEAILSGMAILATFKEIKGKAFIETTKAALDMSEVMDQDLKSSMVMLGKAINDPLVGLSALMRVGVAFTRSQKDQIKALMESGDVIAAQGVILEELKSEFGGAAEEATKTFGGAVKQLGGTIGDLKEEIGYLITKNDNARFSVKKLNEELKNLITKIGPEFKQWADDFIAKRLTSIENGLTRISKWFRDPSNRKAISDLASVIELSFSAAGKAADLALKAISKFEDWRKGNIGINAAGKGQPSIMPGAGQISGNYQDFLKTQLLDILDIPLRNILPIPMAETTGTVTTSSGTYTIQGGHIVFEAKIKGSPLMSFTDGINYIQGKISDTSDYIDNMSTSFTVDSNVSQIYDEAVAAVAAAKGRAAAGGKVMGFGGASVVAAEKALAGQQLRSAEASLAYLQSMGYGGTNITIAPQVMTGDPSAMHNLALEVAKKLKELGIRG